MIYYVFYDKINVLIIQYSNIIKETRLYENKVLTKNDKREIDIRLKSS